MQISGGNKQCPKCGKFNKLISLFTSYIYEDCTYCIISEDKLYTIYCTYINDDNNEKTIVGIKKPTDSVEEFIVVTYTDKETTKAVEKIYKEFGGKGKAMDSQEWDTQFYNVDGKKTDDWDELGHSVQSLEFDGD